MAVAASSMSHTRVPGSSLDRIELLQMQTIQVFAKRNLNVLAAWMGAMLALGYVLSICPQGTSFLSEKLLLGSTAGLIAVLSTNLRSRWLECGLCLALGGLCTLLTAYVVG